MDCFKIVFVWFLEPDSDGHMNHFKEGQFSKESTDNLKRRNYGAY